MILINSKDEIFYQIWFLYFKDILSSNGEFDIKFDAITTDFELAIFTSLKMFFTNSYLIGCYYHFKGALVRKVRERGHLKKEKKIQNFNRYSW